MGWARGFLKWVKRFDKRGAKRGGAPAGSFLPITAGRAGEPLEHRCLLSLGTYSLVEGPDAGSDSDIVQFAGPWTATVNDSWLHTVSSGTGSGLATFFFDVNTGPTRSGTLTIAGETLTVTQAGASYVEADAWQTLVSSTSVYPEGLAVDASGNVYIACFAYHATIEEWNAATQTVSSPVSVGTYEAADVALDSAGNVYIADTSDNSVEEWDPSTATLTTLVSSGLSSPRGVAVDAYGNVYIADTGDNAIKKWDSSNRRVSTLFSGLNNPEGVALDAAGNLYIADTSDNAIKEWNPSTQTLTTLVNVSPNWPMNVAVDDSGNVYAATGASVTEWNAATRTLRTVVFPGLHGASHVAVDGAGDLYVSGSADGIIDELPRAFVSASTLTEGQAAGSDSPPSVLPVNQPLTGIFAPTSDQPWLTIGSVSGGVVNFSFTANTGPVRTAHITVLGQQIAVTQSAVPSLGTYAVLEGPAAGSDSDIVSGGAWSAMSNESWLHTSSSGNGNGLATLTFDANTGGTRTGTLTIAGETLTVT